MLYHRVPSAEVLPISPSLNEASVPKMATLELWQRREGPRERELGWGQPWQALPSRKAGSRAQVQGGSARLDYRAFRAKSGQDRYVPLAWNVSSAVFVPMPASFHTELCWTTRSSSGSKEGWHRTTAHSWDRETKGLASQTGENISEYLSCLKCSVFSS